MKIMDLDRVPDGGQPFKTIKQLPEIVKKKLPSEAQKHWMREFNEAWERYPAPGKRKTGLSRKNRAWKAAWSQLRKKYKKINSGNWIKK